MNFDTIYIEKKVRDHPQTNNILKKIKYNNIIFCENYKEILNSKKQSFRIQKLNPSIILAHKSNNLILETPKNFTIGHKKNFYFSHMLNCIYDCKYCFLQGMFNSANYVVFVNYKDFSNQIKLITSKSNEVSCFFSGYDCDSLAMEKITNFLDYYIDFFRSLRNSTLEIRTKSINIGVLKKKKPAKNVIVAYSLNPSNIINSYETKTPSLEKRIKTIVKLQEKGWMIGLRFDPIIWTQNAKLDYSLFFQKIFKKINSHKIHSVTIGNFRMPKNYYKRFFKIQKNNSIFLQEMQNISNLVTVNEKIKKENTVFCLSEIAKYLPKNKIFIN